MCPIIVLGDLVVVVLAIRPKVRGFKRGRRRRIFVDDTNPQYAFLRCGSKSLRPYVVRFYGMLKIPVEYDKDTSSVKFTDICCQLPASLLGVCCKPENSVR
jgi:hypothetical protein